MSENEKIETEELRFIYRLILEGLSDSDILNKYSSLKDSGELNLPLRTDESFIKDKRKEMEIASEVLKDSIKKIVKIFIPNQRAGHLAQIAEISTILLQNNLNTVTVSENLSEVTYGFRSKYIYSTRYTIKDSNNIPVHLNKWQLTEMLRKNVENAYKRHGIIFFMDCYVPHIRATMSEEMQAIGGFWPAVEAKPYEVIASIKNIMDSKNLKGTCPLCDMENQLPPFIKSTYTDIFQN